MAHGAPEAHRDVRIALRVLDGDVRDVVRQVRVRRDRLRVDAVLERQL